MNGAARCKVRVKGTHGLVLFLKESDGGECLDGDQPGTQAIVDIVAVIGNFIGEVGQLCFQRRLLFFDKPAPEIAQFSSILERTMFDNAFTRFKGQVKAGGFRIAVFQFINNAQ
jgi:hypothetical protein